MEVGVGEPCNAPPDGARRPVWLVRPSGDSLAVGVYGERDRVERMDLRGGGAIVVIVRGIAYKRALEPDVAIDQRRKSAEVLPIALIIDGLQHELPGGLCATRLGKSECC